MSDDEFKSLFETMRQDNAAAHSGTRRHFDIALDVAKHRIGLVAEGIELTREALNQEATGIREEVRRTASETQAMIKFSHAEL